VPGPGHARPWRRPGGSRRGRRRRVERPARPEEAGALARQDDDGQWIPRYLGFHGHITWIVVTTRWNGANPGPRLTARVMRVETLLDAMAASVRSECEQYWRLSRELFELDVRNFLIDNQGGR
jgi:hypothetical protein